MTSSMETGCRDEPLEGKPTGSHMNLVLIKKNFRDSALLLTALTLGIFMLSWMWMWITSRLEMSKFKQILELLPNEWQKLSPVPFEWLVTYPGRISLLYDEPIVLLCMGIWCIARGSDCISGEINRGTMEMLLAQPLGRLQALFSHCLVTLFGILVIAAASWAGIYLGVETLSVKEEVLPSFRVPMIGYEIVNPFGKPTEQIIPMRERVDIAAFTPAVVNFISLGVFIAGVSILVSSWDRYRWRPIGIVTGFAILSSMIKVLGMRVDSLYWLKYVSFFTAYEPEVFVSVALNNQDEAWSVLRTSSETGAMELGPLGFDLFFLITGSLSIIIAAVIFSRRDLPAPL